MLLELSVFLLELLVGIVYPLLMTLKVTVVSSPDYAEKFQAWVFYWVVFILLQHFSWYLDFFLWNVVKTVILVAFALPQLQLSTRTSNYVLGPFKTLVIYHLGNLNQQFKQKLG